MSVQRWLLVLVACGVLGVLALAGFGKWQMGRVYSEHGIEVLNQAFRVTEVFAAAVIAMLLLVGFTIARHLQRQIEHVRGMTRENMPFRSMVQNSPDVFVQYDRDCRRVFVSESYERVYGNPVEHALGKKPTESWGYPLMAPAEYERSLAEVIQTGQIKEIELDWHDADGKYHCQSLRVVPEFDLAGEVVSVLAISRDVTELRLYGNLLETHQQELVKTFHELSVREHHQRALLDHFPLFVWLKDTESRLLFANSAYARAANIADVRELEGKTDFDLFPHDLAQRYVDDDNAVIAQGEPKTMVEPYLNEHNERRWMETWKSPLVVEGHVCGTMGFSRDVTGKLLREQELLALVDNTPDTIERFDRNCRRLFVNSRMKEHTGGTLEQLLGVTPSEFPNWDGAAEYEQAIRNVFASGEAGSFEQSGFTATGWGMCSHVRLAPERGPDGNVVSVLAVGRDITEIDTYRQRIRQMAFYDTLTELPNRTMFSDLVRQAISDAGSQGLTFGLMMLDLDHFKEINDTLGHGMGDLLLREAANRLTGCVRSYDTVARLGGDEFAILLPDVRGSDELVDVACRVVEAFNLPFLVSGKELFVSTSIGIALYPSDSADIDALFRYADSAMYHAKNQGRNNYQFYVRELMARSDERMALESTLRKAESKGELELYYQPQVDLASGAIIGAEALIRWNHKERGLVSPDKFIPVAEESGIIVSMGEWVLLTACEAAVTWNQGREIPFRVAVPFHTPVHPQRSGGFGAAHSGQDRLPPRVDQAGNHREPAAGRQPEHPGHAECL